MKYWKDLNKTSKIAIAVAVVVVLLVVWKVLL
jgi:hypothetical protein